MDSAINDIYSPVISRKRILSVIAQFVAFKTFHFSKLSTLRDIFDTKTAHLVVIFDKKMISAISPFQWSNPFSFTIDRTYKNRTSNMTGCYHIFSKSSSGILFNRIHENHQLAFALIEYGFRHKKLQRAYFYCCPVFLSPTAMVCNFTKINYLII